MVFLGRIEERLWLVVISSGNVVYGLNIVILASLVVVAAGFMHEQHTLNRDKHDPFFIQWR